MGHAQDHLGGCLSVIWPTAGESFGLLIEIRRRPRLARSRTCPRVLVGGPPAQTAYAEACRGLTGTGILASTLEASRQPSRGLVAATGGWTESVSCSSPARQCVGHCRPDIEVPSPWSTWRTFHISIIVLCLSGACAGNVMTSGNLMPAEVPAVWRAVQGSQGFR